MFLYAGTRSHSASGLGWYDVAGPACHSVTGPGCHSAPGLGWYGVAGPGCHCAPGPSTQNDPIIKPENLIAAWNIDYLRILIF